MSEKKEKEKRRVIENPQAWVRVDVNPATGRPMIISNLDAWWKVMRLLTLALHAVSDKDLEARAEDEKKILVAPAMPGLKEMKS